MTIELVPLHKFPQYMLECCKLINDEWKRSETARLRSLECSSDKLPSCLILLKDKKVIGHAKLSVIPSIDDACFVESVVIDKSLRGNGFGTILMKKTEDYCKDLLNLSTIYLSTKGQERFYSKLGYIECEPISIYGSFTPKNNGISVSPPVISIKPVIQSGPLPPPLPESKVVFTSKTFMMKKL